MQNLIAAEYTMKGNIFPKKRMRLLPGAAF
jgi:hypothetical protein